MRRNARRAAPGLRWLHCSFCANVPLRDFVRVANDRSAEQFPAALCLEHFWVLRQGGAKGRVHGPTGIRWWLADWKPQEQPAP
jgi:hypothetical protein